MDVAGDVDGDGFDDIAVGAGNYPGSLTAEGVAYVFRGSPTGIIGNTLLDAYLRLGTGQSGALGSRVAGAGDVNGDGFADVIRGARSYDAGQVGNVSGAGDVNGDLFDDIVLGGDKITLFLGSATGIVGTDLSNATDLSKAHLEHTKTVIDNRDPGYEIAATCPSHSVTRAISRNSLSLGATVPNTIAS